MRQVLILTLGIAVNWSAWGAPFKNSVSKQEILKHGKEVFLNRCSGCHGVLGDGKGKAARFLNPRPRDFTGGVFKFKSTPNDALPTDHDLIRTIDLGVLGTSMPSFKLLPQVSKFAVAQYIKTFSQDWQDKDYLKPPMRGATFPQYDFQNYEKFISKAKVGRTYFKDNCVICHGLRGTGDGPSSKDLVDEWEQPLKPGNLRNPFIKSGR